MNRPAPFTEDHETSPFFAAAADGELALCQCACCYAVLHLPRSYCRFCGSWETTWKPVRPAGTLYSWTVVEHQVHPAFPVPYTLVLVSLTDYPDVRLVGNLEGRPELRAGMPMAAVFQNVSGATTVNWEVAEATA